MAPDAAPLPSSATASAARAGAESPPLPFALRLAERLTPWGAVAALCVWMFASQFTAGVTMAYRDSGHFYIPLLDTVRKQWGEGRLPLWNPSENGGQPLLADGTSGVLYPGKLIFALPGDFLLLYKIYIVGHVVLAYAACYAVARQWGADRGRATLAALSYAFCGNVLFQYCNVIFLVGAAWLPVAWWCGDRLLETRSAKALLGLATALALMVLAGDPQAAYLATVVLGLRAIAFRGTKGADKAAVDAARAVPRTPAAEKRAAKAASSRGGASAKGAAKSAAASSTAAAAKESGKGKAEGKVGWPERLKASPRAQRAGVVLAAAMWAWMLAAVQILPTQEYSRQSQRAEGPLPRTLFSLPGWLMKSEAAIIPDRPNAAWYDAIIGRRTHVDGFHCQIYEFSVGPWRALEYVVPYFGGENFPVNKRWLDCWRAESLLWTPTLYMGLAPLLLALAGLSFFRGDERRRWLSWTALLSWLMSWGGYGIGWLITCAHVGWMDPFHMSRYVPELAVGPEFGGLYWLAVVFIPGWESFRFPAKMLVPAGLALSLLVALPKRSPAESSAADDAQALADQARDAARLAFLTKTACTLGLLCLAAALATAPWWNGWFAKAEPDLVAGPLDAAGAWRELAAGGAFAALLAGALAFVLPRWNAAARQGGAARAAWSLVVVGLTVFDLGWNNGRMIHSAPDEMCVRDSVVGEAVARLQREAAAKKPAAPQGAAVPKTAAEAKAADEAKAAADLRALADAADAASVPARVWRIQDWHPKPFEETSSPDRMAQLLDWERQALVPRHPLSMAKSLRIEMAEVTGTINLLDHIQFFSPALRQNARGAPPDRVSPRRGMDAWNVRYFVVPTVRPANEAEGSVEGMDRSWREPRFTPEHPQGAPGGEDLPAIEPTPEEKKRWPPGVKVLVNDSVLPRVRVVRRAMTIPPLGNWYGKDRLVWLQAMLFPVQTPLDLREAALLEVPGADGPRPLELPQPATPPKKPEVRIASYDTTEVALECDLASPGVVVFADAFDPGWEATLEIDGQSAPQEILKTNRIMRGVVLNAGKQRVVFRYFPTSVYLGAAMAVPAWLVTLGLALFAFFSPARFDAWTRRPEEEAAPAEQA